MKFDQIEGFEVQAEAFRLMTGYMAPGKDESAAGNGSSYEDRLAAWDTWWRQNGDCVRAVMVATQRVVQREGDDE